MVLKRKVFATQMHVIIMIKLLKNKHCKHLNFFRKANLAKNNL